MRKTRAARRRAWCARALGIGVAWTARDGVWVLSSACFHNPNSFVSRRLRPTKPAGWTRPPSDTYNTKCPPLLLSWRCFTLENWKPQFPGDASLIQATLVSRSAPRFCLKNLSSLSPLTFGLPLALVMTRARLNHPR